MLLKPVYVLLFITTVFRPVVEYCVFIGDPVPEETLDAFVPKLVQLGLPTVVECCIGTFVQAILATVITGWVIRFNAVF
jgi:hypothetical protein